MHSFSCVFTLGCLRVRLRLVPRIPHQKFRDRWFLPSHFPAGRLASNRVATNMAATATQGASLTDLREDEKLKIGNLLRELARSQREAQQASNDRQEYASRLQRMRVQNDSIIQVR